METIRRWGYNLKVFYPIIPFISVYVVYLHAIRNMANKGFDNKTMHPITIPMITYVKQINFKITVSDMWIQYFSVSVICYVASN